MRLIRKESGQTLADDLREARGPLARMRGLMAKTAMPGDGLLIEPADSIHTFFMRMPIDLIFLDRDGRVVKRCPAVPPWRIRLAPRGARLVLELPAGFIARHAIEPGDSLAVVDRSPPLSRTGGGRALTVADYVVPALVGLLALLGIVNSFAGHLSPDNSIYLLHTRTFVQTLDRFTLSHDSKGIMLCFALALPVLAFGATMIAGAFAQLIAHGAAALCLFSTARSYAHPAGAATLALLGLCTVHSHLIWGGNVRPEDFALGYTAVAFLAAWRRTPRWLLLGGGLCACCLFTKITLVFAPAAVLLAGCLYPRLPNGSEVGTSLSRFVKDVGRCVLWAGLGFGLVAAIVIAWVARVDSLEGMYRQCVQWPADYRRLHIPGIAEAWATAGLFNRAGLGVLLATALLGLLKGWLNGLRRLTMLLAVFLLVECFRITVEGARWPYTLTVAVLPMLLGSSLLLYDKNGFPRSPLRVVLSPLCALLVVLAVTARAEGQAFRYRVWSPRPSPYEHVADRMRAAGYREGDTVFVQGNDYQLILLLQAPRPYPILPFDFKRMPKREKAATRQHYAQCPPRWVVTHPPKSRGVDPGIKGHVDYAYHIVLDPDKASIPINGSPEKTGAALFRLLPASATYREVIDTGCLQAWRLVDAPSSPAVPEADR